MIVQTLHRILNLRPGDLRRGGPFFAYYCLIVASYVMGGACASALFLDRFQAVQLPYADIAIAAMVGAIIALYIRASRRTGQRSLLMLCLGCFAASAFAFWWAVHYSDWPWLFPVLYVWVGIFGVLATTQVWTLANFVWTTREAKRLFALLGSGGILGGIAGGLMTRLAATQYGTESLLILIGIFLLLCIGLVEVIWRQRGNALAISDRTGESESEKSPTRSLNQSFRIIRASRLLQMIAILICISSVATTVAGWQFKAVTKATMVETDAVTAFFGSVTFYTGILSLIAQLLLTSKIFKHFGVGVALLVLPTALMGGSAGLLLSGSLAAATILRGSDKVLRYSVDKSATELLYLPIPTQVKLQVKSFIDTVIWRLGDGLAGFTILIFAATLNFSPRQLAWVNLAILGLWIAAAIAARREYIATLSSNIQGLRLDPERHSAPALDVSTTTMLGIKLNSQDPSEIVYALSLFEMGRQMKTHSIVHSLLEHPAAEVRAKAIAVLNSTGDRSARALIAPLVKDPSLDVRTEALLYMTQHCNVDPLSQIKELGDFSDYSIGAATVAFLSRQDENGLEAARVILDGMVRDDGSQGRRTRLEAARLIGSLPDYFEVQLTHLLHDPDPEVAQHAIRAAGKLRKRRCVPVLVERLDDTAVRNDAVDSLVAFGESIAGTLRDYLNDDTVSIEIRRQVPNVLLRLGTPRSLQILAENLIQADNILRYRIISALNKLSDLHREVPVKPFLVETVLIAEIMGHYRSYQILASSNGAPDEALRESMKEDVERIFRLMKLLTPGQDLQSAYLGLQSKDPLTHANALEFLDNTLKPQLRSLLVPLIDSEVSETERTGLADRLLGIKVRSQDEAIAALRSTEDPWLRSCAELWASQASHVPSVPNAE